jgi:hypothetical protein
MWVKKAKAPPSADPFTVLVNCPYVIREPRMRLGGDHNYNYYSREMNKHTVFPR